MMKKVTKAVIPAAGLGTRVLPATKAMPKEMLPIVDKPAIQYIVEEAVSIPSLLSLMAALGIATALPLSASALSTLITVCGLLNWGVRIASCLFGFYLFRQSAARRMRAMKDDSTDDDRYRTELERRGGPSRVAVVLVGVLLLVCSFAFSAWIGPDRLMSAFYLY